jgi:bud site selection protein 20
MCSCYFRLITLTVYRVKALKAEPYTQKEAEAAAGLFTDNGVRRNAATGAQQMDFEMQA